MTSPGFDARRFKALERAGFNRIAARYADGAPIRAGLQKALLDAAALEPGQHVLDLAAGPGRDCRLQRDHRAAGRQDGPQPAGGQAQAGVCPGAVLSGRLHALEGPARLASGKAAKPRAGDYASDLGASGSVDPDCGARGASTCSK